MKNHVAKAMLLAMLACVPLCTYAEGRPKTLQDQPDTVWVRLYHSDTIRDLVFSPDGLTVVSACQDGTIKIIDVHTGDSIRTLTPPDKPFDIAFNNDGHYLYSSGIGSTIYCWRIDDGSLQRTYQTAHNLPINAPGIAELVLSKNQRYLATCGFYEVIITDLQTGTQLQKFQPENQDLLGHAVCFSPDDNLIAVAGQPGWIYIVDVLSGKLINSTKVDYAIRGGVQYSPDGNTLLMGCLSKTNENYVVLIDQQTLKPKKRWDVDGTVNDVEFSPAGNFVLAASEDGYIRIWDTNTGELIRQYAYIGQFGPQPQYCIAVSPDSAYLASANKRNFLWNAHWTPATDVNPQQPPAELIEASVAAQQEENTLYVKFSLASPALVTIQIVDALGRVQTMLSNTFSQGEHLQQIPIADLAHGTYFCLMQTQQHSLSRPFTINK